MDFKVSVDPIQKLGARIISFSRSGSVRHKDSADEPVEIQKSVTLVTIEELDQFEPAHFDAEKFVEEKCITIGEKALKRLCGELGEHSRLSLEEMRKDVYKNYVAFIRTSKEITQLDGQLQEMKHLLAVQAALIHGLAEQSQQTVATATEVDDEEGEEDAWIEDPEPREIEQVAVLVPEQLDILLAERRIDEAIQLLEQGEEMVARAVYREGDPDSLLGDKAATELGERLADKRERLQEQLAETTKQATVSGEELREAVWALHRLGDSQRAHTLLLSAHKNRVRTQARYLKHSGSSYGGAYTVALSQLVFSSVAAAARDSVSIWQDEPENASELVLWAQKETEWCASLLKCHVMSSSGSAGGLHAAAECVTIALGHCSLLEEQGLSLSPVLSKLMRPSVEEAVEAHIFRIEESVAVMAAADSWRLLPMPTSSRPGRLGGLEPSHVLLSSSAQRLYFMLQDFVEDLAPVINLQLMGPALDRMGRVFETYVGLLIRALPAAVDEDEEQWEGPVMRIAYEEEEQLALLGNVSLLADELLPRLAARLTRTPDNPRDSLGRSGRKREVVREGEGRRSLTRNQNEQKEWRRRLQKAVDKLRDILCSCLVEDFIYGEEGQPLLTADEYIQMDTRMTTEEWQMSPMPSPPFQALFVALNAISGTAADILEERERVVTVLLMRLVEWMVMGLMVYSQFWEQFEDSEYALGPVGLQQLVLDMYFVMQVAANGKFTSRPMRKVALDSMAKAITMYKEQTEDDPNRVLEKDSWFQARCQEAIHLLLENHPAVHMYADDVSPLNSDTQEELYDDNDDNDDYRDS